MALVRKTRLLLFGLSVLFGLLVLTTCLSWSYVERYAAGIHQRSVTRSLAEWGAENASVTNDASAIAAAEMVGYISHYYPPGPGYHGPVEVEAALERQRAETLKQITDALQRFTHLDYGTNAKRWSDWAELQRQRNSKEHGTLVLGEPQVLAIARAAVATNDSWVDRAEFERPERQADGTWSVLVWRVPKVPGGQRLITIDETGKIKTYIRGR